MEGVLKVTEWTGGELYGFYTSGDPKTIIDSILDHFSRNFGYQAEHGSYEGEESFLFFENQEMMDHHLDNGYNLDLGGKGCFCIEQSMVDLDGTASLFELDGESNFQPFEIALVLDDLCYLRLVLPAPRDESEFCRDIYNSLRIILRTIKARKL